MFFFHKSKEVLRRNIGKHAEERVGSQRVVKLWREKQHKPIRNEEIEEDKRKKGGEVFCFQSAGRVGSVRKKKDEKSEKGGEQDGVRRNRNWARMSLGSRGQ